MRIVLVLVMLVSLASIIPMMFVGINHPTLSVLGVAVLIGLGWQAANLFDAEE